MRPDEDTVFVAVAAEASRPGRLTVAWSEGAGGPVTSREGDRSLLERIIARRSVATFDATTVGAELGADGRRTLRVFDLLLEIRRQVHTECNSIGDLVALLGGDEVEVAAAALGELAQVVRPSPQERATAELHGTRFLASRIAWNRANVSQALLRGSYAAACGAMDQRGIPVDAGTLANLLRARGAVRHEALAGLGPLASLFVGFALNGARGDAWARDRELAWPRGRDGRPVSDHRALQDLATVVPELREVLEVASLLNQLAAPRIKPDRDGRVRVSRRVCAASTGRDVFPGDFIFGQPRWMRCVISPSEGRSLVHVDIEAADVGVAAGLARDAAMQAAYDGGFYERLARSLHTSLPLETIKNAALGTLYRQMEVSLSRRLGVTVRQAKDFIIDFYRAFPDLRRWFDRVALAARTRKSLETPLGWRRRWCRTDSESAMRAFMVQGTTANVMQHAVVQLDRAGVELVGTVHDAIIAEAPAEDAETVAEQIARAIRTASAVVLDGFELRSKSTVVRGTHGWPLRGRALNTWERVSAAASSSHGVFNRSRQ